MAKEKARYFTFLLYPESIPSDWGEIRIAGRTYCSQPFA